MRRLLPVLVLMLLLALPASAPASPTQFTIFEAPRELMSDDAGLRGQTLDEIQSLGARHIRVLVYWQSVETSPGAYDWARYDRVIREAAARGITVIATLTGPFPRWASASGKSTTSKPRRDHFRRFAAAAGARYGDVVNTWSIWNEPNHPQFLRPQFRNGKPYSPRMYRGLFRAARAGLRDGGQGADRVLAGETAPRGTPRVVSPLAFLRGTLRGKGRLDADGWAHHPYTTRSGPFFRPDDRDDVTIGVLSRLTRALDRAARAGKVRRKLGIYLTEFGIQSEPDPYVGVSEARQAEFRSISERIAWGNPRVRAFSQYLMRDDEPRPGSKYARYSGFESGLRHSSGKAKKAYEAFRLPLSALRRGRSRVVELWGLVRPGSGRRTVVVEHRSGKTWRRAKRDHTDGRGFWRTTVRYRKGRRYRVRWTAPDGRTYTGPATRTYRR